MRAVTSILAIALLSGCAGGIFQKNDEQVTFKEPVPSLSTSTIDQQLYNYAGSLSQERKLTYFTDHDSGVAQEIEMSWCADENDSVLWRREFLEMCARAGGAVSGSFCYRADGNQPLFSYKVIDDRELLVCPDEHPPMTIQVIQPYDDSSMEWYGYAHGLGFMSKEALALSLKWDVEIEKHKAERERKQMVEAKYREAKAFYKNKQELEGKYNQLVCQKDEAYPLLGYYYVGRVIATFDEVLHVQLFNYVGNAETPDNVTSQAVVEDSYSEWEMCDG